MKKIWFPMLVLAFLLGACATSAKPVTPTQPALKPSPLPQADLQATAQVMAEQTIAAMPTLTLAPSPTPVANSPTPSETATETAAATAEMTATDTPSPALETLTATLGTGTPFTVTPPPAATVTVMAGTITVTLPVAATITASAAPSAVDYPQTYGTMPPNLPAGKVTVYNSMPKEAYVSVQCETKEGYNSIVEFPLGSKGKHSVKVPTGWCHTIVWVDGKTYSAGFNLKVGGNVALSIGKKGITTK